MEKLKKLLALLLVSVMILTVLSACGNSEKSEGTTAAGTANATVTQPAEDMAEINLMVMSLGATGDGKNAVQDAINAITEKEINTHVTLSYIEVGSYAQQLSLAITGNEKVDLCLLTPIPAASFSALLAQNQLVDLSDLLPKYAPDVLSTVGDIIKGTTVNGKIYSVVNYRDIATKVYVVARKDFLESSAQLDAFNNMKSWTEYENIMKAVTAKNNIAGICNSDAQGTIITMTGFNPAAENFADNSCYDNLGDVYKMISCDSNGKVSDYFETADYKNSIDRVRNWYKEGLVYKDAATAKDTGDTLMKTNVAFSQVVMGESNIVGNKTASCGHEIVVKEIKPFLINTNSTQKFSWAVPVSATEKEAAIKFMNLMYSNKDIMNLLSWGIEGRDYVVKDGVANFPEGVTSDNVQYHSNDFLWGNSFLALPWSATADMRTKAKEIMDAAEVSPFLGFTCDTTKLSNELTAIQNVISQYEPGLESGTIDKYSDFIKALKDAGVDKVVAEYQKQLDAWKTAK